MVRTGATSYLLARAFAVDSTGHRIDNIDKLHKLAEDFERKVAIRSMIGVQESMAQMLSLV